VRFYIIEVRNGFDYRYRIAAGAGISGGDIQDDEINEKSRN